MFQVELLAGKTMPLKKDRWYTDSMAYRTAYSHVPFFCTYSSKKSSARTAVSSILVRIMQKDFVPSLGRIYWWWREVVVGEEADIFSSFRFSRKTHGKPCEIIKIRQTWSRVAKPVSSYNKYSAVFKWNYSNSGCVQVPLICPQVRTATKKER